MDIMTSLGLTDDVSIYIYILNTCYTQKNQTAVTSTVCQIWDFSETGERITYTIILPVFVLSLIT